MSTIQWYDFNWFDIVIFAVVALSVIVSFFRGFIREAISLITWILALILALRYADEFAQAAFSSIHSANLRYVIAFVIIFVGVLIVGIIVNMLIRFLMKKSGVGLFDRLLGVIFGAARGILLVAVVIMLLQISGMKNEHWLAESRLATQFEPLVAWLSGYVPKQIEQVSKWIINHKKQIIS